MKFLLQAASTNEFDFYNVILTALYKIHNV
jgi:hypothetical protein